jgi:hypothetical protein
MFTLRILSTKLHKIFPSTAFTIGISNQIRLKHKVQSSSGGGGGGVSQHPRSGKRESGRTHHGKDEKMAIMEDISYEDDISAKLLNDS